MSIGLFYALCGWKGCQLIAVEDIGGVAARSLANCDDANFKNQIVDLSAGNYDYYSTIDAISKAEGGRQPWIAGWIPSQLVYLLPYDFKQMFLCESWNTSGLFIRFGKLAATDLADFSVITLAKILPATATRKTFGRTDTRTSTWASCTRSTRVSCPSRTGSQPVTKARRHERPELRTYCRHTLFVHDRIAVVQ